jgi:predicted amidophosphoribosyltransferase
MNIVKLKKYCPVCGEKKPVFKNSQCNDCGNYLKKQWEVTYRAEDYKKSPQEIKKY